MQGPPSESLALLGPIGVLIAWLALSALASHATTPRRDVPSVQAARPNRPAPTPSLARSLRDGQPIDINRARQGDLELLPGIGPSLAKRILEDRTQRGDFERAADLARVRGIGPGKLKQLYGMLCAGKQCARPQADATDAGQGEATTPAGSRSAPP